MININPHELADLHLTNPIQKIMDAMARMNVFTKREGKQQKKKIDLEKAMSGVEKNLEKDDNSWWSMIGPAIIAAITVANPAAGIPLWVGLTSAGVGGYLGKQQDLKGAEKPLEEARREWGGGQINEAIAEIKDKKFGMSTSQGLSDAFMEYIMPSEFGFENLFGKEGIGKGFFKDFGKEKVKEGGKEVLETTFDQWTRDFLDFTTMGLAPSYGDPKRKSAYGEFAKLPDVSQANLDAVNKVDLFKSNNALVNSVANQMNITPEALKEHADFDSIITKAITDGTVQVGKDIVDIANPLTADMIKNKAIDTLRVEELSKLTPASQWMFNQPWSGDYASMPKQEDFMIDDYISGKVKKYDGLGPILNSLLHMPKQALRNPYTGYMTKQLI